MRSATRSGIVGVVTTLALLAAGPVALAQVTTCKTSNCAAGNTGGTPNLPDECEDRAGPRIFTIQMDGATLRFQPDDPRLEGRHSTPSLNWSYQCIRWHKVGTTPWHSATEDTAGNTCDTSTACSSANVYPDPCSFETGNIDSPLEWSVCHYRDIAPGAYPFRCRLHDAFGMDGTLTIVPPIELRVDKGTGGSIVLEWATGGSTNGPWEVLRDTTAPMPASVALTGATGTSSRTLTDASPPAGDAFYLVRECNLFGGSCIP